MNTNNNRRTQAEQIALIKMTADISGTSEAYIMRVFAEAHKEYKNRRCYPPLMQLPTMQPFTFCPHCAGRLR